MTQKDPREQYHKYGSEPFFPNHVLRQAIQFVLLFALLILLSSLVPAPMLPKADPFETPEYVKPAWYFLGAYQFLKISEKLAFLGPWAPKVIGVLAQGLGAMVLWFLPFWDRNPERHPDRRPTAIRIGIALVFFFLIMTIWGYFS
jgi:quinol-cytochrome oxidoreductase complex cytochrome b subunit